MISAKDALQKLIDGNKRYVTGDNSLHTHKSDLVDGQKPFAVVIGCSDSRVAPEIVFDQGSGELFVVRVAGNVVGPLERGSVEYAVEHLGVQLVIVLGHTGCGAVNATLSELENPSQNLSHGLKSIVENIKPSVIAADLNIDEAIRENVRTSVKNLEFEGDVQVVGAEFCLESGAVTFL
ncbi:MAG: carbonic anhydrase [bacterium]|nr:carbonic anhydrase [bacterium]MCP4800481.1 carbonic anhydrase [bacterium]